jgi:hypothetical protein
MALSEIFSDNQLAVLGCFVALGVCGLITAISFHLGPASGKTQRAEIPTSRPIASENRQEHRGEARRAA